LQRKLTKFTVVPSHQLWLVQTYTRLVLAKYVHDCSKKK
jgi:hypothetical protein